MTLVASFGHRLRGDDAAGPLALDAIQDSCPPGVRVLEVGDDPTALLDAWGGREVALVIDAIHDPSLPCGRIVRLEVAPGAGTAFQASGSFSSHGLGLAETVALGRALGHLPRTLVVYGVAGRSFALGDPLSGEVTLAIPVLARRILAELEGGRRA